MRKNSFDGFIWSDICCEIEDKTGLQAEEALTSTIDGSDLQYVIMYPADVMRRIEDQEIIDAFKSLGLDEYDLIFVQV